MVISSIILAAGQGTRMRSSTPKVLHHLSGKPLLSYAIDAVREIGSSPVLVVGWQAEQIRQVFGEQVQYAVQEEQLGTAHAVSCARQLIKENGLVLVLSADMPFITSQTLQRLIENQSRNQAPLTITTTVTTDARGFGRVVRDAQGDVEAIIEEAHASEVQRAITEVNVGVYCFQGDWLFDAIDRIKKSPKGEYYLTDTVALARKEGFRVDSIEIEDPVEAMGINTRVHLAEAERMLQERINAHWMLSGVTLQDPGTTYIGPDVKLGEDVNILPNTHLVGNTIVATGAILGPNSVIMDSEIGANCRVIASFLEGAKLEEGVNMGPYCHLRKGAHLGKGVHLGNFGEIKNSFLGPGTKMGHFSYVGDAQIGKDVNISAGVITCNFDGKQKNITTIEDDAFIGSDTMLVAPVKIGKRAKTGAGAVVNRDVPEHTLVVGVPAREIKKLK